MLSETPGIKIKLSISINLFHNDIFVHSIFFVKSLFHFKFFLKIHIRTKSTSFKVITFLKSCTIFLLLSSEHIFFTINIVLFIGA